MIKRIFVTRVIDGKTVQRWEDSIEEKIEDVEIMEREIIEKAKVVK